MVSRLMRCSDGRVEYRAELIIVVSTREKLAKGLFGREANTKGQVVVRHVRRCRWQPLQGCAKGKIWQVRIALHKAYLDLQYNGGLL